MSRFVGVAKIGSRICLMMGAIAIGGEPLLAQAPGSDLSTKVAQRRPALVKTSPTKPETPGLSLKEALKAGFEYSQEIKSANSVIQGSEASLDKARGSLFPTINGSASVQSKQNSSTFTSGSAPSLSSSNAESYTVALNLSQPLYAGGAMTGGLNYYKVNEDLARQNFFTARQSTGLAIIAAYYTLAQTEEILELATQNRDILKNYVEVTRSYERVGRARKMDRMQAEVNYSTAVIDVEKTQNDLKIAAANLNRLMGQPLNKDVRTDFRVSVSPIGDLSTEKAFEAGKKNNPGIRARELALEQVSYSEELDLSTDKPSVNLLASTGYSSPDRATLFDSSSRAYSLGLNLTVPLFSGLTSVAKRRIYTEQRYQAERNLQIAEDALRASLEQQLSTLRSTDKQLETSLASVQQARAVLEAANKAYSQGTASANDVTTMQRLRYDSERQFVNIQYSYLNNLVLLRRDMGIDLEKTYGL